MGNTTYNNLANKVLIKFVLDHGKDSLDLLSAQIGNHNNVNAFLIQSMLSLKPPSHKEIVHIAETIDVLVGEPRDVHRMASIIILHKWNKECNEILHFANEQELLNILTEIILEFIDVLNE
jgi:hypothetical protein